MTWLAWERQNLQSRSNNFATSLLLSQTHLAHRQHLVSTIQKESLLGLIESNTEIYFPYDGHVNCMAFEKVDERFLLCGTSNNQVVLYDTLKHVTSLPSTDLRKKVAPLKFSQVVDQAQLGIVTSIDWYPNDCGIFIATSINGVVQLYDTANYVSVLAFNFDGRRVYDAKFRPITSQSYRSLVAAGVENGDVSLCDVRTGDNAHTIHAHTSDTTGVDWNPYDENQIASCSRDGTTKIWDIRKSGNATPVMVLDWSADTALVHKDSHVFRRARIEHSKAKAHESEVLSVRYSPCGQHIITSARDTSIRLWSSATGQLLPYTYKSGVRKRLPYRLEIASFSHPSDNLLIVPGGASSSVVGNIDIIPLYTGVGKPIKSLKGHWDHVEAVVYANHSQRLISASRDGMIWEWKYDSDRDHNRRSSNGVQIKSNSFKKSKIWYCERQTGVWLGDEGSSIQRQQLTTKNYSIGVNLCDTISARQDLGKPIYNQVSIKTATTDPIPPLPKSIIPSILIPLVSKRLNSQKDVITASITAIPPVPHPIIGSSKRTGSVHSDGAQTKKVRKCNGSG